jgi:hypothetical protein
VQGAFDHADQMLDAIVNLNTEQFLQQRHGAASSNVQVRMRLDTAWHPTSSANAQIASNLAADLTKHAKQRFPRREDHDNDCRDLRPMLMSAETEYSVADSSRAKCRRNYPHQLTAAVRNRHRCPPDASGRGGLPRRTAAVYLDAGDHPELAQPEVPHRGSALYDKAESVSSRKQYGA